MDVAIDVQHLTKIFRLYDSPAHRLKEFFLRRPLHRDFKALDDVSFSLEKGRSLGVIGRNGAGKSTLLKIIMGVLVPDSGKIDIRGKVTGLLELGTGFQADLTGRQNIFVNGAFLGLSRKAIEAKLDAIEEFAELGPFMDEPLKTYSSGMVMRLAFAVAIHADPAIFLIDEALSVGDVYFQQKCIERIRRFRAEGGSLILVSHDLNAIRYLCDSVILLDEGRLVYAGGAAEVTAAYNRLIAGEDLDGREEDSTAVARIGYGDRAVEIAELHVEDMDGHRIDYIESGAPCRVVMSVQAHESVDGVVAGILLRDRLGQDVFGTNTFYLGCPRAFRRGEEARIVFCFEAFNLAPGAYSISAALHQGEHHTHRCHHWIDEAATIKVAGHGPYVFVGVARQDVSVTFA